jgi:hypothetical protein
MTEEEIVYTALENLDNNANIKGIWENTAKPELDGILKLNVDNREIRFDAEVKLELRNFQIKQIFDLNQRHQPFILSLSNRYL